MLPPPWPYLLLRFVSSFSSYPRCWVQAVAVHSFPRRNSAYLIRYLRKHENTSRNGSQTSNVNMVPHHNPPLLFTFTNSWFKDSRTDFCMTELLKLRLRRQVSWRSQPIFYWQWLGNERDLTVLSIQTNKMQLHIRSSTDIIVLFNTLIIFYGSILHQDRTFGTTDFCNRILCIWPQSMQRSFTF